MVRPEILEMMKHTQKGLDALMELSDQPGKFIELLDAAGVEKAGLINYVSPDIIGFTNEVNEYVSRYCKDYPDRLIPFGSVHPMFTKDAAGEMDRLINDLGIRAIKVHPPHQLFHANDYGKGLTALETIYAKAQDYQVPVMIHTGTSIFPGARNKYSDPMDLDDIAVDFPDLKIILAHGGRPLYMDTAVFLVRRHRNIYLEISSIPPKKLLQYFPRLEELADKTMFGSDWPGPLVPGIKENIDDFMTLKISDEAKRKILRETALCVFKNRKT
jgi:predicted TIM-barrel fold metal-dependent hydrolase